MIDEIELLTVADVAEILNVTEMRVRQLCMSGELEARKHGRRVWLITRQAVNELIERRREKQKEE